MSADPFAGIREASAEAAKRLARSTEESRQGWKDDARAAFDDRYSDRAVAAARKSVEELRRIGDQLHAALTGLG